MSGFCSLGQPALVSSKTPPPTHRGTGRITVDAREKGLTACIMQQPKGFVQGTVRIRTSENPVFAAYLRRQQAETRLYCAPPVPDQLPKHSQKLVLTTNVPAWSGCGLVPPPTT